MPHINIFICDCEKHMWLPRIVKKTAKLAAAPEDNEHDPFADLDNDE